MNDLRIVSPKRNKHLQTGWEGFFPYYAGFPQSFAGSIIESAKLPSDAVVLDPWNGSGTTTYAAARLGMTSIGQDINPAMIVVARARMLAPSEADTLEPLARSIVRGSRRRIFRNESEALLGWFAPETAAALRSVELTIRTRLLGSLTLAADGANLDHLSSIAAAYYVALFSVARELTASFRSSNPTWMRKRGADEATIHVARLDVEKRFLTRIVAMAAALAHRPQSETERAVSEIRLADSTAKTLPDGSVDLVLTSPPYCTRIDYTAATRIELAILAPLLEIEPSELSSRMIGSVRVPAKDIAIASDWGPSCLGFLEAMRAHPSKASGGYYLRTHLDYFDKMGRSLSAIERALKPGAAAVLVVQDSYYKDLHNDLPTTIQEMGESRGLILRRREDFEVRHSMARINPRSRRYSRPKPTTEAVLCFERVAGKATAFN